MGWGLGVIHHQDDTVQLHHGDCLDVLRTLPDNSIDSVICDPPYGLANTTPAQVAETITAWVSGDREHLPTGKGFMGKAWDAFVPPVAVWDECLRVLKPGGHALVFAGSRTHDLMTLGLRLAGFDIRDTISWLYGSGFPKSHDISKAVDKLDAADERRRRALEFTAFIRESGLTSARIDALTGTNMGGHYTTAQSQPAVATADLFDKLRPLLPVVPERIEELVRQRTVESENYKAREVIGIDRRMNEPSGIVGVGQGERTEVERKITNAHTPAAQQWQGWGSSLKPATEPIVVARKPLTGTLAANVLQWGTGGLNIDATRVGDGHDRTSGGVAQGPMPQPMSWGKEGRERTERAMGGRWPTNVALDADMAEALDAESGTLTSNGGRGPHQISATDALNDNRVAYGKYNPTTSQVYGDSGGASRFFPVFKYQAKAPTRERPSYVDANGVKQAHSTVKPLALMSWLCRLVTPPGGTILEPFAGSGTTVEAAITQGFRCIAVEREADYLPLILARLERARPEPLASDASEGDLTLFGEEIA